jgi:hypothetical protein
MKSLNEFDDLINDGPVCFVEDQWDILGIISNLTERDPQVEQKILRSENPKWAYLYDHDVIKGRWPEAEPFIMQDPEWAYYYACFIINGRWREAEPYILKNPEWAYYYARHAINGRWREAEPFIMKDPEWAKWYAKMLEAIGEHG